jgi:hypothetical protein
MQNMLAGKSLALQIVIIVGLLSTVGFLVSVFFRRYATRKLNNSFPDVRFLLLGVGMAVQLPSTSKGLSWPVRQRMVYWIRR